MNSMIRVKPVYAGDSYNYKVYEWGVEKHVFETREELFEFLDQHPSEIFNANDYIKGGVDARRGVPHDESRSANYTRGYAAQYQLMEMISGKSA